MLRSAIGIGVAGWTFAGSQIASVHAVPPESETLPSSRSVADTDWRALAKQLRGRVIPVGDKDYATAKQVFNTRYDRQTPAAVVQVATVDDIAPALAFAAEHNLVVSARAGGHSYIGASAATDAMIIDLRQLKDVRYRDSEAVVGAGVPLSTVYRELAGHKQTIPAGMCPMVGAAGLTLGGGIGFESRRLGLTCDNLTAATIVRPDGVLAEVSGTSHPELFWALRGGGGAPLGVVTSFTYRTHSTESKDIVRLTFPGRDAARAVAGWNTWLRTADRGVWANISVDADGRGGMSCWAQIVCAAGAGLRNAAELLLTMMVQPKTIQRRTLPHLDAVRFLAGGGDKEPRTGFTSGSDVVEKLSEDVIARIIEAVAGHSRLGGNGWVQINPLDGAVQDVDPADTAFPWRRHEALIEWGAHQPVSQEMGRAWIAEARRLIGPASAGGYVNYLESGDRLERYYAQNLAQLNDIRRTVDPAQRMYTALTDAGSPGAG